MIPVDYLLSFSPPYHFSRSPRPSFSRPPLLLIYLFLNPGKVEEPIVLSVPDSYRIVELMARALLVITRPSMRRACPPPLQATCNCRLKHSSHPSSRAPYRSGTPRHVWLPGPSTNSPSRPFLVSPLPSLAVAAAAALRSPPFDAWHRP